MEEKKSEEALPIVQKKHDIWRYQNERDGARRLLRSGNSRRVKKEMDLQHSFSSESCRSSTVDHVEEIILESPTKMQEVQEVMEETAWKEARGREEDAWRLEQEGKRSCQRPESCRTGLKASTWTSMVKVTMNGSKLKKSRSQSDVPGEEGEDIQSPKRK